MTEAERVARETPALPGDVIVAGETDRYLVRWAELRHKLIRASCGCCTTDDYEYKVYIDEPWDGPVAVIAAGGGTVLTMPLKEWWGTWPPKDEKVYRDGHQVYPKPEPVPEMDFHLEPDELNP